jgi:predicted Holliday junction resolvase-like endonuclease
VDVEAAGVTVTVEQILKEKNRKLETHNMQLQVTITEKEQTVKSVSEKLMAAENEITKLKELNTRLEEVRSESIK